MKTPSITSYNSNQRPNFGAFKVYNSDIDLLLKIGGDRFGNTSFHDAKGDGYLIWMNDDLKFYNKINWRSVKESGRNVVKSIGNFLDFCGEKARIIKAADIEDKTPEEIQKIITLSEDDFNLYLKKEDLGLFLMAER